MHRNHEHGSLHSISRNSHRSSGHDLHSSPASERAAHRAFAEGRRRLYVAREGELEAVSRIVADEGRSLVVHAASGAGKSSLVASWCHEIRLRRADIAVVEFYAASGSGDRWALMRHVLLELAELLGLSDPIPSTPEGLQRALHEWLWYAHETPLVVVIDGADRIADSHDDMLWLPRSFPPCVRFLVTTARERTRDELSDRGWATLALGPLTHDERQKVVERVIAEQPARIAPGLMRTVMSDFGSANPLLLRTRVEELGRSVRSGIADRSVGDYLAAATLEDVYAFRLQRLEQDHGEPLVRDVLSLLVAVHEGLDGRDLIELTGVRPEELHALLDDIRYDIIPRIDAHGERFDICHDHFRHTIAERYSRHVGAMRFRLTEHLWRCLDPDRAAPLSVPAARGVAELARQLNDCRDDDRLRDLLLRIPVMTLLWNGTAAYELLICWRRLADPETIEDLYAESLDAYRPAASRHDLIEALAAVAAFAQSIGRWEYAARLRLEENALAQVMGDDARRAETAGMLGALCRQQGDHAAALVWHELQLDIACRCSMRRQESIALGHIGMVFAEQGRFRESLRYHSRQEEVARSINDKRQIIKATAGQAIAYDRLGDHAAAVGRYESLLRLAERTGDRRMMAHAALTMGGVYSAQGEHRAALDAHARNLAIAEELGDPRQCTVAHFNMALVYVDLNDYENAIRHHNMSLEIARRLGFKRSEMWAAAGLGDLHAARGDWARALEFYRLQRELAEETSDEMSVAYAIGGVGMLHMRRGDQARAEAMLDDALDRHRSLGHVLGVVQCLLGKAVMLVDSVETLDESAPLAGVAVTEPQVRAEALNRAASFAEECHAESLRIDRADTRFESTVLLARIDAARGMPTAALHRLEGLNARSESQRAALHFAFGIARIAEGRVAEGLADLRAACRLYGDLFERTGDIRFRDRSQRIRNSWLGGQARPVEPEAAANGGGAP